MAALNSANTLAFIQNFYQTMDQLHLSLQTLAVIGVIVLLAFCLAIREVAAWFFKIDDLKKDIRSLELSISRLEGELQSLHKKSGAEFAPLSTEKSTLRKVEQFPISH